VTGTIFLIGLSGSGKSTVGPMLAERLGRGFVDTDDEVERAMGHTVAHIFATKGELGFRSLERAALARIAARGGDLVIAVGGGAVLAASNQEILRAFAARTVWLRASPDVLAARLGDGADRPLLADGPLAALERLDAERRDIYDKLADMTVDVDMISPDEVVDEVLAALGDGLIRVPVLSYTVLVGRGATERVGELLPTSARRAALVTQKTVPWRVDLPIETARFDIGDGEEAKSLATVERLCRGFAEAGLTRTDVVVSVGGGVVSDVAGFAASVYHRGVAVVHVPTTLLAQVDAAIGGKTGVNLPEGKNLVGTFWQPAGVCCDTAALDLLPEEELRSGRGEMVKYAFIGVPDLAGLPIEEQVARCVALKASVVADDERESGRRMILNYGHTLAHALEAAQFHQPDRVRLRHGEAVAVGLVFASRLARLLGRIGEARVREHVELVAAAGLPTGLPAALAPQPKRLVELMRRDKKATAGLTFVLDGAEGVEPVYDVPEGAVFAALAEMEAS
jgi:5-deoxy-5-amino-3-dehydroquinate synthase